MCGFCVLLGGAEHWSELSRTPLSSDDSANRSNRQRERLHRIALLNRITQHYGVQVNDWAGTSWVLSHVTGGTEVIDRLALLWPAVERLAKRRCDPLSPSLLTSLGKNAA